MDRRMDSVILICHPKFLRGHKRQTTKFFSGKFESAKFEQKVFLQAISYSEFRDQRENSVDIDEVAHDELPHLYLCCLQIQLFSVMG